MDNAGTQPIAIDAGRVETDAYRAYADNLGQMEDGGAKPSDYIGFDEKSIRAGFIRKVFGILTVQLSVVVGLICLFVFHKGSKLFVQEYYWLYYVSYGVFLVSYIAILCCKSIQRKFPGNVICLSILTLSLGFMTAMISSYHDTTVVLMAMGVCAISCLSVVIFALQTKFDFTKCIGAMFILTISLFLWIVLGVLLTVVFHVIWWIPSLAGLIAFLFMMWLAIDVQLLMGGKEEGLSPEDYIFATTLLFLDVITIFLCILYCLVSGVSCQFGGDD